MKETRASIRLLGFITAIAIVLTGITLVLLINVNGDRWINKAYNTRIAAARKTTLQGTVYDSTGTALAWTSTPGTRSYIDDYSTRLAFSQTLGDQNGQSSTGVEIFHASILLGFTDTRTEYTLQKLKGQTPEGQSIVLTMNAELTEYVSSLFKMGQSGACVIINYKTGAILAKVSLPQYDPANMDLPAEDTAYYDRVLQKRYAPGSTFKIITLAAALESLPGVETETFNCSGVWNYSDYSLKCASGTAHGSISLKQAFAKSCNVTFGSLAYQIGAQRLKETAERFGFNYDFSFADVILNESHCLSSGTGAGAVIQAGIGQGTTEITPLHLAMISGAIANGGDMMEPKLIKQILNASGSVASEMQSSVFKTVASSDVCQTIARYMYETVKNGTGTKAQFSGYTTGYICGKTGSAEWTGDKTKETNAWYTGFLYDDDAHPYAIAVVVEEGGAGGTAAAPIAASALKKAVELNVY